MGVITHTAQQACMHVHIPTGSEMKIEMESKAPSLGDSLSLSPVINLKRPEFFGQMRFSQSSACGFLERGSNVSQHAFCECFVSCPGISISHPSLWLEKEKHKEKQEK